MIKKAIKVLVVDDSAMMREFLRKTLEAEPDIMVVGTAQDPYFARDKFLQHRPDVITLDIEMPRMDGLTFLEKLIAAHPTPVVMISTRTQKGAEETIKALSLGAVDFVSKPTQNLSSGLNDLAEEIVSKVRTAAGVTIRKARVKKDPTTLSVPQRVEVEQVVKLTKAPPRSGGARIILMGASTGGTVALEAVLTRLPDNLPPIAIVQHMPEHFTGAFASRLNQLCRLQVVEASDGLPLKSGMCAIAPGGKHMFLKRGPAGYAASIKDGPPVNRHKPSVDVLFRSAVGAAGPNSVAVIMTGMGDDGAKGMKDLHDAGAFTVAQDEESCTVYGMPKAAMMLGAVDRSLALDKIAPLLIGLHTKGQGGTS